MIIIINSRVIDWSLLVLIVRFSV